MKEALYSLQSARSVARSYTTRPTSRAPLAHPAVRRQAPRKEAFYLLSAPVLSPPADSCRGGRAKSQGKPSCRGPWCSHKDNSNSEVLISVLTSTECNMHECSPEHAGLSFGCVCVRTQVIYQNITSCHLGTNQRVPHTLTLKLIQTAPPEISLLTCLAHAASGSCRSGSRRVCRRPFCHASSGPISSPSQSQNRRGTP